MKYEYQEADVDKTARPGSEQFSGGANEDAWLTVLGADTAEEMLDQICDYLNDEYYPTESWVRVKVGDKVLG